MKKPGTIALVSAALVASVVAVYLMLLLQYLILCSDMVNSGTCELCQHISVDVSYIGQDADKESIIKNRVSQYCALDE